MPGGRPKGSKNQLPSVLQERILKTIKTRKLIRTLQNHIDGKVKLDMSQVKGALGLLAKVVPSKVASDVSHSGSVGTYVIGSDAVSLEEWDREAAAELGTPAGTSEATH
jgi:hypothetical protein